MSLKWIDHPRPSQQHEVWQLLIDERGDIRAMVEGFGYGFYANTPQERSGNISDLTDAKAWCERKARPQ